MFKKLGFENVVEFENLITTKNERNPEVKRRQIQRKKTLGAIKKMIGSKLLSIVAKI